MSFIKNIFRSKPSAEELIQATSKSVSLAIVKAMEKANKAESRKRQAKELQEPEQEAKPKKPAKEPKKRRVEAAEPTPAPTVEANPADVKPADAKPVATQEPVLLTSKTETPVLSLLTEREVASLSAEETKRKQGEADKFLQTHVMNRVRLEQQNNLQQALTAKANMLLGALTGQAPVAATRKPKSKPKKKKRADEPPRVTCAAMTTKGKRCRRKPSNGSTKCSEHNGLMEQTEERGRALGCNIPDMPNVPKHKIVDEDSDFVDSDNDE